MQKIIITFVTTLILTKTFGQTPRKVTTFLFTQFNKILYDPTLGNNPWGVGLGLQTFFNNKTKFTPTIELTGDIYLEDDKVLRMNTDGTTINDISEVVNLFVGTAFRPKHNFYISFIAGPSFISGQTLFGVKPSVGCYFSKNKRWAGKLSYINVFNRAQTTKGDFGSISLAVGVKLF